MPRPAAITRPRRMLLAAIAALAVATLAACAAGPASPHAAPSEPAAHSSVPLADLPLASEPRTHDGPSTAVLDDAAITPVAADPSPVLPVTVSSHDPSGDVPVEVTAARRIVAFDISGSIAGTLVGLGLGDRLVARDVATTVAGTEKLPLATTADGQSVNAETILSLRPDLVLTDGTVGPTDVVQQLRQSGIAVVYVAHEASFAGAATLARQVADAVGVAETGRVLATAIADQVSKERAAIAAIAPKAQADRVRMVFLYLRGGSGIYYLFGKGSGADDLIAGLDGIDAAKAIGWSGMKPMTDEAIVSMDPDLILVMTDGLASAGGVDGLLKSKPAIALTAAGQHRRFVDMADGDVLSFGPRSAGVLDALARAVYAPVPEPRERARRAASRPGRTPSRRARRPAREGRRRAPPTASRPAARRRRR